MAQPRIAFLRLARNASLADLVVAGAALVVYAAAFFVSFPFFGRVVGVLAVFPIFALVRVAGLPGGIAGGVAVFVLDTVLYALLGYGESFLSAARLTSWGAVTGLGLVFGFLEEVESARRRGEREFARALENSGEGVWVLDVKRNRLSVSPGWFKVAGCDPAVGISTLDGFASRLHPDESPRVLDEFERLRSGASRDAAFEYRVRGEDGSWRWLHTRGCVAALGLDGAPARLVGVSCDMTERKNHEDQLVFQAYHDQLTRLPNRKAFFERAVEMLASADRSVTERTRSFVLLDLDDFKHVNDSMGHKVGDLCLRAAAERLQRATRRSDFLFHLGANAFMVVLSRTAAETDAAVFADKTIAAFAEPFAVEGFQIYVGLSAGIALYPRDGLDPLTLIRKAESALREAKRERNAYRFFSPEIQERAKRRVDLLSSLRKAVAESDFTLAYQPIQTADGRIESLEALIRWKRRDTGDAVPPGEFIPLAEESGLIVRIGRFVLDRALADLVRLSALPDPPSVAVNVSARQLRDRTFVAGLRTALERSGADPRRLRLEITESSFLEATDEIAGRLRAIRELGVTVSLDDFGTGYSSLAYLRDLPIDEMKIDRLFVRDLPDPKARAIVVAVLDLARGLGKRVVAEGVASAEARDCLARLGCERFQGEFLSPPRPIEDLLPASTPVPGIDESGGTPL